MTYRWKSLSAASRSPPRWPLALGSEAASAQEVPAQTQKIAFSRVDIRKGVHLKDATLDLVFSNLYRSTFCHRLKAIFESIRVFSLSPVSTFIVFNNIANLYCIVNLHCVQQQFCQPVLCSTLYCQPVLCSTIVLSTCIVFFCRLIPIRLGFDSLPVLHKVGGRSGDVKGPEDSLAGPLLILFLPTWSWRVPSWPLVVWPLRCWSSWALLKVIIYLHIWDRVAFTFFNRFDDILFGLSSYHRVFQDLVSHPTDVAQAEWETRLLHISNMV